MGKGVTQSLLAKLRRCREGRRYAAVLTAPPFPYGDWPIHEIMTNSSNFFLLQQHFVAFFSPAHPKEPSIADVVSMQPLSDYGELERVQRRKP